MNSNIRSVISQEVGPQKQGIEETTVIARGCPLHVALSTIGDDGAWGRDMMTEQAWVGDAEATYNPG